MKTLATIFNWVLGGFVMVGAWLASVRFQDAYGILNYLFVLPFASALAVRYLKPNFWLALFSIFINVIAVFSVVFFVYEVISVLTEHDSTWMPFGVLVIALPFVLNLIVIFPMLRAKKVAEGG